MKIAATATYNAVPFLLSVTLSDSTKRVTVFEMRQFSSAHWNVTGSAASKEVRQAAKYVTPALVVWRFLHVEKEWGILLSAAVSLLVLAPFMGIFFYMAIFRFLRLSSQLIKVVVTIGLSVVIPVLAVMIFGNDEIFQAPADRQNELELTRVQFHTDLSGEQRGQIDTIAPPDALQSFRASLAIAERLAKADAGNAGWQRDLSVSYEKVGNVLAAQRIATSTETSGRSRTKRGFIKTAC